MQLNQSIELANNVYAVTLTVAAMTAREQEALGRLGAFAVECGGVFVPVEGGAGFTLPADERLLPDQFPVRRLFDVADLTLETAKIQAQLYSDTMRERIHAALSVWLSASVDDVISNNTTTLIAGTPSEEEGTYDNELATLMDL